MRTFSHYSSKFVFNTAMASMAVESSLFEPYLAWDSYIFRVEY